MTLQELVVDLRLNAEEFARGLESAMTTWESFGSSLLKIGAGLSAALTVPIVGIGQAAIKMGTQLQQAEIAFGTMLGSAELAGNYLNELKDFAAKTPFEFSELVPAAKRLMALGFAAEETIPMMKALGNAAAGLGGGAALIQRLGLALGQMRAKAKVSAEEMRQLAEAGIPAWEMLAKAMGKSTAELMKLSEKGQVSAAAAIPILIQGINEKFGGLMEGFMQTAMGQYSNVKDQLGFVLADIGKALLPIAAMLIEKFALPAVSALRDLASWFSKLNDSTKTTIIALAALVAAIGPVTLALGGMGMMYAPLISGAARVAQVLIPMFGNIATAIQTNMVGALTLAEKQLLGFVGVAGPALIALGAAFVLWQIPAFQEAIKNLWDQVKQFWNETVKPFANAMLNVGESFLKAAGDLASSGLTASLEFLKSVMTSDAVKEFGQSLTDMTAAVKDLVAAFQPLREVLEPVVDFFGRWAAISVGGQITLALEALKLAVYTSTELLKAFTDVAGAQLKYGLDVGKQGVDNLVSTLGFLKPVVDSVLGAFTRFIDWIKQEFPIIAVIAGYVGEAYDKLKAKTESWVKAVTSGHKEATDATVSSLDRAQAAMEAAKKEYGEIQKAAATWDAAKKSYGATEAQLLAATEKLTAATKAHSLEMDKAGLNAQKVTEAVFATRKAYAEAQTALSILQDKKVKGLATDEQVIAASRKVSDAERARTAAMITLSEVAKRTGTDVSSLLHQYEKTIPAVKTLEDQEKALKEAIKAAQIQLDIALRSADRSIGAYDGSAESVARLAAATGEARKELEKSKASYDRIVAATQNLQAAQDRANPEKYGQRVAEANAELAKHINDIDRWVKEWEVAQERIDKADKELETSLVHTALVFGKAVQQMRAEAAKEIEITTPIQKRLPEVINETLKRQADLQGAYKATGVVSIAVLKQQVAESKQAYDTISADAALGAGKRMSSEYEVLQVTRAYYADLLALERATNGARVKDYEKAIDKMDERLKKFGEKQRSFWVELGQAIQGIMMNWAADIGRGLWDTLLGKNRREFNKGLDQQAADLNASLQERTQEWEAYQSEIAARQEAAQKEYEDTLAEESAALQEALDERVQDYADAEAETVQKLDEVRAEYAKDLADQLSDLAESLEERRVEYEDYVQEIARKLAETRQAHADQLAEQLSDLEDALDDHRRSYDDYVRDVNKKLSRVGEDYAESIDDETKQVKAGVEDKKKQYKRDEDDILEKIARLKRAGKKEQDEEIQDLRKSLRRKAEDLEEYIRESSEKLDEFVSDAQRRNDREVADLKESLAERSAERARYQEENQNKRNEYINKNAQDLAKEEAELARSLADRTADWVKYQADNAQKIDEAYAKYAEGLAKEEKDLIDSLAKKKQSLDDYIVEVNKKWAKIQEAALAKLNQEESDLAASLVARQAEYDKYVQEVAARLDEIKELHKSAWDEIGSMIVGAFELAGESVMTFITTYLMDKLLNALTKGTLWDALTNFGKKVADIFTGGGGTGEAPQIPGIPRGIPQGPGEGTGEGSDAAAAGRAMGKDWSPGDLIAAGLGAFKLGWDIVSGIKWGSVEMNTHITAFNTKSIDARLEKSRIILDEQNWRVAGLLSLADFSAARLLEIREILKPMNYASVLEDIRGILDNIRSLVYQIREGAGQLTSSVVDVITSPFTSTVSPGAPTSTGTADELDEARRKLEEARVGVGIASASSAFADELEKLFTGDVGEEGTEAYLKRIAGLAFQLKESGVLSAKQYEALSTAIDAMIDAGNIGPGADAVRTLVEQLREAGSTFDDWARKVEENSAAVNRLTAQLAVTPPMTPTSTVGTTAASRGPITGLLDAASTAARLTAGIIRPAYSVEELTRLLAAQQATQAITAKKIDPFNPLGAPLLAERDKLAAEIAALEAANQTVSDEMRRRLQELSQSQPVLTQEAYLRNIGAEYQSWLSGMIARTKGMLEEWAKYNAAIQAIADLGQRAADLTRAIPGMINPLSQPAYAGAASPNFVIRLEGGSSRDQDIANSALTQFIRQAKAGGLI